MFNVFLPVAAPGLSVVVRRRFWHFPEVDV